MNREWYPVLKVFLLVLIGMILLGIGVLAAIWWAPKHQTLPHNDSTVESEGFSITVTDLRREGRVVRFTFVLGFRDRLPFTFMRLWAVLWIHYWDSDGREIFWGEKKPGANNLWGFWVNRSFARGETNLQEVPTGVVPPKKAKYMAVQFGNLTTHKILIPPNDSG
jgi:hypothetical protein